MDTYLTFIGAVTDTLLSLAQRTPCLAHPFTVTQLTGYAEQTPSSQHFKVSVDALGYEFYVFYEDDVWIVDAECPVTFNSLFE